MPTSVLDIPTWQRPAPTTEKLEELVDDLRHAVTDVGFWCVPHLDTYTLPVMRS